GPAAGVDDVEAAAAEGRDGVVEVGLDELGVEARAVRQGARRLDRRGREVEPRDARAAAGPRERVEAEVALGVDQGEAADGADLLEREGVELRGAGQERLDVVEVAVDMDRHALVPPRA